MTLDELAHRWMTDLPAYCRSGLKVMGKGDAIVPLVLNPMQQRLHKALEAQKAALGRVRAIILKARQMGCSTYVAARFFHRMHLEPTGARAYLLAHEDDACVKLVAMYRLMWDNHEPLLRRPRSKSSDHGFAFLHGGGLESDTASTPSGGRGGTKTLYHWSETAFARHYAAHSMGSLQQVAKGPGTEIILESTPNGPVGGFYERWRNAEQGRGEYIPHFAPWTEDPEYVARVPAGFTLSREAPNEVVLSEHDYHERHGCTMEQMAFRRALITDFDLDGLDGALKFTQEYPISADEAFLSVWGASLMSPAAVEAARRRPTTLLADDYLHPLILGLDAAPGHSSSASALAFRRGGKLYRLDRIHGMDAEALIEHVYRIFCDEGAARLCIDVPEGTGEAVYRALMRRPVTAGKCVRVVFGGRPSDRTRWYNKRAEIWWRLASWITDGGAIVDEQGIGGHTLASELLSVQVKRGSERVLQLEGKDDIIKRIGHSPDGGDAAACTFALPDPDPQQGGTWVAGDEDGPARRITGRRQPSARERYGGGAASVYNPRRDNDAGF